MKVTSYSLSFLSGWLGPSAPHSLRAGATRQIRHAGRRLRVRLRRAVLGRHGHRGNRHSRSQTDGQHRVAGPPGPAAHQEATGQDRRAEGPVSRLHGNIQVL